MASSLGDKIIKISANSQGVKAGVDQAQRELDRLSGVASKAGREIDSALNKLSEAGGRRTTGTTSSAATAFDRFYRSPQFLANGREPLSRAIARTDFETAAKGFEQSLQAFAGLSKEFGIFSSVVKGSALKFRSAEAATEAAKDAQYRLASAINREVNAQNASLVSRLAAAGTRGGGNGIGAFRLTPLDDPDRSDANRILDNIRAASSARRPIGPSPFSARRAQGELEEANKVRRDAYDREQAAKQIAETLEKQKRLEDEANRILAARNRVISSLASQRAAALADPKNLAALNRFERSRGQALSTGVPQEREPFAVRVAELAQNVTAKTIGLVGGGLRRVGGFIVTEFTNFISRVAANLTSRLIAGAVEGVELLATKFVQAAARFEDALVSFGVLAGSEGRGATLVGELQKLAVDTPFRLQEVLDESKLLLSYGVGVDDLTKRLRQLGDVASGTGVDLGRLSLAFGQTLAKGRLQGPEIRQFTEAGVAVRDFAAAFNELTGRNVSNRVFLDLVEQGEVSSKVVEKAFDKMTGAGGRFFNFMEVRSKTVSGRFNALLESFELFAQKVGKSLFDRLGVGVGIDSLVKKLQGINFEQIDRVIGQFAPPIQKFAVQVFSGFEAFIKTLLGGVFGGINVKDFSSFLKFAAETFFPKLIDGGLFLADVFLAVGQAALRFVEIVEAVYALLPNTGGGSGRNITALLGGAGAAALGGSLFGGPVGALAGVTTYAASRALGFDLFGKPKSGSESDLARLAGAGLSSFRDRLSSLNGSSVFERAAKERANFELAREASAQEVARQRLAEQANADLAKQNASTPGFRISDERLQKNIAANLVATLGIEADRRKALSAIPLVLSNREYQRRVDEANKVFDDRKAGLNDPRFVTSNATAADVKDYAEVALKFNSALKKLNEQFLDAAQSKVPGFTKRIEELVKKLPDIGKDEGADFRKDLQAIAIAGSAKANLLGVDNAIKQGEVDKLLGQRTLDFIAKFKSPDLQPAPLIRQASQEAEQSLTRAIYESRNVNKPIEQQLLEAEQNQAQILEGIRADLKESAEAAKKRLPNMDDLFFGAGFPP